MKKRKEEEEEEGMRLSERSIDFNKESRDGTQYAHTQNVFINRLN